MPDLIDTFPARQGAVLYEGLIKVKLVHARAFSLIVPDVLALELDTWRWFQAKFFSACLLSFLDDCAYAQLGVEPAPGVKLTVGFTRDRLVRAYDDGSFLYRCRVSGPARLRSHSAGSCTLDTDERLWLDLFHHTSAKAASEIRRSGHFRGSRWNIQGSKRLNNVEYVYFTSLPKITSRKHLERIAMATDGRIHLLPTNGSPPRDLISIAVYRESTLNRRSTVRVRVPAEFIAPQHVWRHDAVDQPTYYEMCHPEIYRVGLEPGTILQFVEGAVATNGVSLKRFDYVVLGYAATRDGIVAPYDEEDTRELFKIERCSSGSDLFRFWQENANSDQYSARRVERQTFEPKVS
jgi:hypothetical protein